MARQKLIKTEEAKEFFHEYLRLCCDDNPLKFKYSKLAEYISNKTQVHIQGYHLRHDTALYNYIESFIAQYKSNQISFVDNYSRLDVEKIVNENRDIETLRIKLKEISYQMEQMRNDAISIYNQKNSLESKCNESIRKNKDQLIEIEELRKKSLNYKNQNVELRKKNKKLCDYINETVNQDIARALLDENGLSFDNNTINLKKIESKIIKADTDMVVSDERMKDKQIKKIVDLFEVK